MKNVAIIGGGYTGLAAAFRLAPYAKNIHIFDEKTPGCGGSSSVSAGLMHPMNRNGDIIWKGREGYLSSKEILYALNETENSSSIFKEMNLFRPMKSKEEFTRWQRNNLKHPDMTDMFETKHDFAVRAQTVPPDGPFHGAVAIKGAIIVNSPVYLETLWRSVQKICPNSSWYTDSKVTANSFEQLLSAGALEFVQSYDDVVLSCGAGIHAILERLLPSIANFRYNRGRHISFSQTIPPLHSALLCGEYVLPVNFNGESRIVCGSTRETNISNGGRLERDDDSSEVLLKEEACNVLAARAAKLYPLLRDLPYEIHTAGVRVVPQRCHLGRLPVIFKWERARGQNVWIVTGMGSRGLIYHSLLADYIKQGIITGDERLIPSECFKHIVTDQL